MRRAGPMVIAGLVYFCIATVIAQAILLAVSWSKGLLTEEKLIRALAGVHGIALVDPAADARAAAESVAAQGSHQDLVDARFRASLDLDLREMAMEKGLLSLRTFEKQLKEDRRRLELAKDSFQSQLAQMEQEAVDSRIRDLRTALESMRPQGAKDQLVRMLEDRAQDGQEALQDVVTIITTMPVDRRSRILDEFKSEAERQMLAEILQEMRTGTGSINLIRGARGQIDHRP